VARALLALFLASCTCEQPVVQKKSPPVNVPAPVPVPDPPPAPRAKKMAGGVRPDRGRLPIVVDVQSRDK